MVRSPCPENTDGVFLCNDFRSYYLCDVSAFEIYRLTPKVVPTVSVFIHSPVFLL